jgi:hypothetical protein
MSEAASVDTFTAQSRAQILKAIAVARVAGFMHKPAT